MMITNSISPIYLSICIPTNGRIEILRKTLDSIFYNTQEIYSDFEVVISDNSDNDELSILLESYKQFPNIGYNKTNSAGFLNSINALRMGKGMFLKLHNNYTMVKEGSLEKMIYFIKKEQESKPLVFFTNNYLKSYNRQIFHSFDNFSNQLSYWNTWSTGFSIWKSDFEKYSENNLSKMFPQTSLLVLQNKKKTFIIDDNDLFINQPVPQKGGYNLFRTFCIDYLSIMNQAKDNEFISQITFEKIKEDLFKNYLVTSYCNTKIIKNDSTFDLTEIRKSFSLFYPLWKYYWLIFLANILALKIIIKKILISAKILK